MRLPQAYDAAVIAARADDARSWTERYGAPLLGATRPYSPGSTGEAHPRRGLHSSARMVMNGFTAGQHCAVAFQP